MRRRRVIYANTYQHRRRLWFLLISAGVVAALVIGWWLLRNPRPDPTAYPVLGVRLDQTDGVQDFDRLRSSRVSFVYLKATEGSRESSEHRRVSRF